MNLRSICLLIFLCTALAQVSPAIAKDGVEATVHTTISANAEPGTQIEITWTLADAKSGKPLSALMVFIRLIGSDGDSTEAFAAYTDQPAGSFKATATIPRGGVALIDIGVAGTITDRAGNSRRSDWLMELANNPVN